MGVFSVPVEIAKIMERPKFHRIERILVDTGSEMTWIAAETLRKLGITVRKKDQAFVMANGQTVTRDIGYALIRSGQFETVDEVVFARKEDLQLLGSHTLEGFNAVVDPKRKRLVAAGPMPAARNETATTPSLAPRLKKFHTEERGFGGLSRSDPRNSAQSASLRVAILQARRSRRR